VDARTLHPKPPTAAHCQLGLAVYQPRRPQETPLFRLVEDHFETLLRVHEEEFEPRYGRLRRAARRAVEKFLDCGVLERGFARVRCDRCRAEFLVTFGCKARVLCPSCHAKRLEIWSDWLEHQLLYAVPHRQYVFTVPKRLRPFFLHDRRLLGVLSRVAYKTLRDFMRTTLREPDVVPGVVASIQSFGSLLNFHPHLHCLVTDGAFRPDGTFLHLGYHEIEVLTEAFRRAVLRAFVRLDLLTDDDARSMLQWPHSGFHVDHSVRLEADDACGILQLARYSARAPISLERLQYDARKHQVTLHSDKREGPTAGTHLFPALEFLAMLLTHVPNVHERLVREYGAYSTRRRARWRQAGILSETRPLAAISPAAGDHLPDWPALRAMRQRWAELLKRIYEIDPLRCGRCGGEMRIVSFILNTNVIAAILRHLRRKGRDPRALPEHAIPSRDPP
jgi:hypothetical protein